MPRSANFTIILALDDAVESPGLIVPPREISGVGTSGAGFLTVLNNFEIAETIDDIFIF
jgi:hypothetical protein